MKNVIYFIIFLALVSCSSNDEYKNSSTGGSGSSGGAYCYTGYCYSYLEGVCCPRSAPYACNGYCYTYSGGGGCSSYKTTCY